MLLLKIIAKGTSLKVDYSIHTFKLEKDLILEKYKSHHCFI